MSSHTRKTRGFATSFALAALAFAGTAYAQVVITKSPQIGSSNPVTAEPPVSRPSTTPCKVKLFTNLEFADFNSKIYSYTPPAQCPGPWAKVVFTADFTVTKGIQYDRTAQFYLGHANIFYGTTAEPSPTLSPSWHVERDLTDLSAILQSPQTGEAILGNIVNSSYTGIIYAKAELEFYPASHKYPAASAPDAVIPLPDAAGGAATLSTTASELTQNVTLPTNVERAYLDLIAQSQSNDEFWYTCVPSDLSTPLQSCGGTGFRETEVTIDGTPAGVAPVYPWIFTGGLDPNLWIPIPGVQTLNFKPYRVDLTPFAGLLSDGSPHTVGISVFNANSYFLATANLLIYTDHGKDVLAGKVLHNTLTAAPSPVTTKTLKLDTNGYGTAKVGVGSSRSFSITGELNTSHGKVVTTVAQHLNFLNAQQFDIEAAAYIQDIRITSTVDSTTTTRSSRGNKVEEQRLAYPFSLKINVAYNADGGGVQTVTSDQRDLSVISQHGRGENFFSLGDEDVKSTDSLGFDSTGNITSETGQQSSASDLQINSAGEDYSRSLIAKAGVLTSVKNEPVCSRK